MTYPIGIFAAAAEDPANAGTIKGLIHYSPYAHPYDCLDTNADPSWFKKSIYDRKTKKVRVQGGKCEGAVVKQEARDIVGECTTDHCDL